MIGMSLNMVQSTSIQLEKTNRTKVIEFMSEPFGGIWLGPSGFLSVKQIADGSGVSERNVRRVLADESTFAKLARKPAALYRIGGW